MKKKVMRRDPLGREGHFLLEISPTESRGEECRALRDAPWEQSSDGWETGLSRRCCDGDTPVIGAAEDSPVEGS